MPSGTSSPNHIHILSQLSHADFRLLERHLEAIDLPVRKVLAARNKRVEQVYFIESGIASVVANGRQAIEVGIIGREGMTGSSVVVGNGNRAPHETYKQIAGNGLRLPAGELKKAVAASQAQLRSAACCALAARDTHPS